jgi:hypothetical protein
VIVAERSNLNNIKVLISNAVIHIELFEDRKGNLYLSSPTTDPEGIVHYATTPVLVYSFTESLITLQTLFDESPSFFVEISNENKTALYSRSDVEVELKCGDKTMKQLSIDDPAEEKVDTYSKADTISEFKTSDLN